MARKTPIKIKAVSKKAVSKKVTKQASQKMASRKAAPRKAIRQVSVRALDKNRKPAKIIQFKRISAAALANIVAGIADVPFKPTSAPVMELTARQPYTPDGNMDFYAPGRWDTTYNLVFMDGIVNGPSPGEWTGTVGYAAFTAPSTGNYVVVLNFSGYQVTMGLHGPSGTNTAYCATTSDSAAAVAVWSGSAGSQLFFSFTCTGLMGYLESVQVFLLS